MAQSAHSSKLESQSMRTKRCKGRRHRTHIGDGLILIYRRTEAGFGTWSMKYRPADPIKEALEAAGLPSSASLNTIRHTYIARAIGRGIPPARVAGNVGTRVRMIGANYGKFIAATRRELVELTAPRLHVVGNKERRGRLG